MTNPTDLTQMASETLGDLASRYPAASRVFRSVGLDYCCGGRQTLADACRERDLDLDTVLHALQAEPPRADAQWESRPLPMVIHHIVERYHESLRRELPELRQMAATVEEKHADKPACPRGLAAHLAAIHEAVQDHLAKEEQILFPMILAGRGSMAGGPVQVMEAEHVEHGANLARTRALTNDLVPPPEACATWQALYLRLGALEADLMDHIHLENHILFPRALYEQ
jgi:regulator of cell morphogenesis and NO signaling